MVAGAELRLWWANIKCAASGCSQITFTGFLCVPMWASAYLLYAGCPAHQPAHSPSLKRAGRYSGYTHSTLHVVSAGPRLPTLRVCDFPRRRFSDGPARYRWAGVTSLRLVRPGGDIGNWGPTTSLKQKVAPFWLVNRRGGV